MNIEQIVAHAHRCTAVDLRYVHPNGLAALQKAIQRGWSIERIGQGWQLRHTLAGERYLAASDEGLGWISTDDLRP